VGTAQASTELHKIERSLTVLRNAFSAVKKHPSEVCTGIQTAERDELLQFLSGSATLNLRIED
jgi:hypothetical protein